MSNKVMRFHLDRKFKVHIDVHNNRAVISCKTKDGNTLEVEADLQTLDKINSEVRKHLEQS